MSPLLNCTCTVQAQKGRFNQGSGRNKGGLTTKIHAVVDAFDTPLRIHLTAGNVNGIVPACGLMKGLSADKFLVGEAYDANKLLASAERQNHEAAIPPMLGRLIQREYDAHAYRERHLAKCFFAKLKLFRRAAVRYDKLAIMFKAAVILAACLIWLQ